MHENIKLGIRELGIGLLLKLFLIQLFYIPNYLSFCQL